MLQYNDVIHNLSTEYTSHASRQRVCNKYAFLVTLLLLINLFALFIEVKFLYYKICVACMSGNNFISCCCSYEHILSMKSPSLLIMFIKKEKQFGEDTTKKMTN